MSTLVRWTRQAVAHVPAVAIGVVVLLADRPLVAVGWFAASRLAYVVYAGVSLRRAERAESGDVAERESAWRRFRGRAAWLMDNDAVAFGALACVTAGTLDVPLSPWITLGIGVALAALGIGVKVWATASLDPGSYHWRNFFVASPETARSAGGPYRWLSNPMYTVGYAHAYGVAVALRSAPGLVACVFAQTSILALLFLVERPHFARLRRLSAAENESGAAEAGAGPVAWTAPQRASESLRRQSSR